MSCLVVEDDPPVRSAIVRLLERSGYRCLDAPGGAQAIDILEENEPEVVLSDLNMPEMEGTALLRVVRERWPDVAVIMLTAESQVETAVSCLQMGAVDYIAKPFVREELLARIDQAVEQRALRAENRRYQLHLAELVQQQAARIEELFVEGVQTLVQALEAKDAYTKGHSLRVSAYARQTAITLGLPDAEVDLIGLGAELHDVGKIGVREEVLQKSGRLTPDEYEHIMQHTVIGARILAPLFKEAPQALAIVRSHHERMDGHGSPDGLRGEEIPLYARVVSVVDSFDAMTSGRPYRALIPPEVAIDELIEHQGTQFDPRAVAAFREAFADPHALPIPIPDTVRPAALLHSHEPAAAPR